MRICACDSPKASPVCFKVRGYPWCFVLCMKQPGIVWCPAHVLDMVALTKPSFGIQHPLEKRVMGTANGSFGCIIGGNCMSEFEDGCCEVLRQVSSCRRFREPNAEEMKQRPTATKSLHTS